MLLQKVTYDELFFFFLKNLIEKRNVEMHIFFHGSSDRVTPELHFLPTDKSRNLPLIMDPLRECAKRKSPLVMSTAVCFFFMEVVSCYTRATFFSKGRDKSRNLPLIVDPLWECMGRKSPLVVPTAIYFFRGGSLVLHPSYIFPRGKDKSRNLPLIADTLRECVKRKFPLVMSTHIFFFMEVVSCCTRPTFFQGKR